MHDPVEWSTTREELDTVVRRHLLATDVLLDIGCGIRPSSFFVPKVHICVEPFGQYAEILRNRFINYPGAVIINTDALTLLNALPNQSVDSVFLIDVIEHLEKDVGIAVLKHAERVARRQIAIFTPYGYMPQHYENGELDGWGLGGISYQEHRSGWMPEDFGPGWKFLGCKTFHEITANGEPLKEPFGAFWAIRTKNDQRPALPRKTAILGDDLPPFSGDSLASELATVLSAYAPESYEMLMIGEVGPYANYLQTTASRLESRYVSLSDRPGKPSLTFVAKVFINLFRRVLTQRHKNLVVVHRPSRTSECLIAIAWLVTRVSGTSLLVVTADDGPIKSSWIKLLLRKRDISTVKELQTILHDG